MSKLVDFHSHVLPGIDDGSASVEESMAMLRLEAEQGISHVIATPHFYAQHDAPEKFLRRREEAANMLDSEMEGKEGLPSLTLGAEVYFFPGMSDSEILPRLTVGQSRFILVEMPMADWSDRMLRELEHIHMKQGLVPILAHIDRYIRPLGANRLLQRLDSLPVVIQANASFFLHPTTRGLAVRMLREGRIQLLGSDCHNMTDRKPNLQSAEAFITRKFGSGILDAIVETQADILQG